MADANYIKSWGSIIDVKELNRVLKQLPNLDNIAPSSKDIFRAFKLCNYNNLKCIILGMDPYPQKGIATGLAFANYADQKISPSLNVIKEALLSNNKFYEFDQTLEFWAEQGVLLLNSALTVELNKPGSHTALWRNFIIKVLKNLSLYSPGLVYILFGNTAASFSSFINKTNHVLKEMHPAYYARYSIPMDSTVFDQANRIIYNMNGEKIQWLKNTMYEDIN